MSYAPDEPVRDYYASDLDVSPDCDGCHAPATLTLVEVDGGGIGWLCQSCAAREYAKRPRDWQLEPRHEGRIDALSARPVQRALPVGASHGG